MHNLFTLTWIQAKLEWVPLGNVVWIDGNNIRGFVCGVNNEYKRLQLHNKYNYITNMITQWVKVYNKYNYIIKVTIIFMT